MTTVVFALFAFALWAAFGVRLGLVAARMYQIEEYEARRFLTWALQRDWLAGPAIVLASLLMGVVTIAAPFGGAGWRPFVPAVWCGVGGMAHASWQWPSPKKDLVFTARMRRLLAVSAVTGVLWVFLPVPAMLLLPVWAGALVALLITTTLPIMVMLIGVLANTLLRPVESRVNAGYVRVALQRMEEWKPVVIAVAGSYGKTSTKHIMWGLLEDRIPTLATPKSFNTLMGVTRTINENLTEGDRVFIVEMDAYAPGEIAAICRLTRPHLAVVTSVGPQHLERFGTIDRISDALYEAVEPLAPDQPAVMYCGDALSAALADRAVAAGALGGALRRGR
jgi:UDP-N-acetylmuramoyl-tripeptide--D-alanyl-D-alanine ligase